MPHSWTEERGDDPTGDRIPAFLWTPLAWVHQRQSASVRRDDRELPEHRVTIHPVKGLPDRGARKGPASGDMSSAWTAATGCSVDPGCRETSALRDHVCIWIDGNNLGDGVG